LKKKKYKKNKEQRTKKEKMEHMSWRIEGCKGKKRRN